MEFEYREHHSIHMWTIRTGSSSFPQERDRRACYIISMKVEGGMWVSRQCRATDVGRVGMEK